MTRATTVEDYKLHGSFEAIRKLLLDPKYADRMDKPLAYWALPSDRRLPLAFLGRTIGDLLETPFEELCATPGIGQKKIQSLVKLLHRAAKDSPHAAKTSPPDGADDGTYDGRDANGRAQTFRTEVGEEGFDPDLVSEALWSQWRETVVRHRLEYERLGRLAPSLQALPTVIWRTPLKFYAERSLAEIRELRTHGEKRVRVVLEVFYVIDKLLGDVSGAHERIAVRLAPRFAIAIEDWLADALEQDHPPGDEEIREHVARPLLEQIQIDAGPPVYDLAAGRLGMTGEPQSVRAQSRRLGVTRARVYQLLDECSKVMAVRWPEGRGLLRALEEKTAAQRDLGDFCHSIRELFYPDKHDLALRAQQDGD